MSIFVVHKNRGFSFVEVLVACAVIAILATVTYGSLGGMREKARDTQRKSDIEQLRLTLRLHKDQYGTYPTGHDSGTVIGEGGSLDSVLATLLANIIIDPMGSVSDTTYEYVYDTNFTCGVISRTVLYAKTMERPGSGNWTTVCGTNSDGTSANTYGVILQ